MSELNATTRCDKCSAQARLHYVHETLVGEMGPLDLMFCSHHSDRFGPTLIAMEFKVVADTREELTRKAVGVEVS